MIHVLKSSVILDELFHGMNKLHGFASVQPCIRKSRNYRNPAIPTGNSQRISDGGYKLGVFSI